MLGDRKTVVLRGGAPWGFRLSGGGQTPIYIAKVFALEKPIQQNSISSYFFFCK